MAPTYLFEPAFERMDPKDAYEIQTDLAVKKLSTDVRATYEHWLATLSEGRSLRVSPSNPAHVSKAVADTKLLLDQRRTVTESEVGMHTTITCSAADWAASQQIFNLSTAIADLAKLHANLKDKPDVRKPEEMSAFWQMQFGEIQGLHPDARRKFQHTQQYTKLFESLSRHRPRESGKQLYASELPFQGGFKGFARWMHWRRQSVTTLGIMPPTSVQAPSILEYNIFNNPTESSYGHARSRFTITFPANADETIGENLRGAGIEDELRKKLNG